MHIKDGICLLMKGSNFFSSLVKGKTRIGFNRDAWSGTRCLYVSSKDTEASKLISFAKKVVKMEIFPERTPTRETETFLTEKDKAQQVLSI
ncbi:unnamed protein product [Citrullus colocynthis]|uniref:Uncharacterized protein n=1 Tax=Citrullus colocynthis TaxID=252529 RepID=A0ABP0XRJ6_9ROSI